MLKRRTLRLWALCLLPAALLLLAFVMLRPHAEIWQADVPRTLAIMTRNALKGPVRVGIQVGHLDAHLHADEHAELRWNTGGHWDGVDELDVNRSVALELERLLRASGIEVDLLPARMPVHYSADLVLSLHADSVADPTRNGYKSAHYEPVRNSLDVLLKEAVDAAYLAGSPLADDSLNTSSGMTGYYAFNPADRHTVNPRSPALLVELGYISSPADRSFLLEPDRPAALLHAGITDYLVRAERLPPGAAKAPGHY